MSVSQEEMKEILFFLIRPRTIPTHIHILQKQPKKRRLRRKQGDLFKVKKLRKKTVGLNSFQKTLYTNFNHASNNFK